MWAFGFVFFFNDTATTEIYTLSLHDALPIFDAGPRGLRGVPGVADGPQRRAVEQRAVVEVQQEDRRVRCHGVQLVEGRQALLRSEEHTSELQSRQYLVCRLLLEKKKHKAK